MKPALLALPALLAFLPLNACSEKNNNPVAVAPNASAAWLLTEAPAGARTVAEIKPTAADGDSVVLRARIGGRLEPITPGAPVFVVIDRSVPACSEIPGDNCPTPWDYCCEPRESLTAHSATVQVVGPDGSPVAGDLAQAGLKPLDEVIVIGTVAARPSPEVLTIRATGVHKVTN